MSMNGVMIGLARILPPHRAILQGLQPAPAAFIAAARGTSVRGIVALLFATPEAPAIALSILASAWRGMLSFSPRPPACLLHERYALHFSNPGNFSDYPRMLPGPVD